MIHAKVAKFVALLLAATLGHAAKNALAQFPPNRSQPAAFTGHGARRAILQNMPQSAVTGHFLP